MTTPRLHRGADALIRSLRRGGVERMFTLSGNHIMPVFDAAFEADISLVHTRHEASAVHMADAWARISGRVGIALVTGGPGHANAVSALYTAQMAESPIVLLSGHAPNNQAGMGAFQEMRQAEMAAPVCKAAWVCASADRVASDLARAIRLAKSGRPGPVHLSLPSDVLEAATHDADPGENAFESDAMALDKNTASELVRCLLLARRPLILTGPASMTRPARALAGLLEQATGIAVIGMESPRGIADPSLGAFAEVLSQSDCILLIGKRLDFTLKFGGTPALSAEAKVHQIDAEQAEIDRSRRALGARLGITALAEAGRAMRTLLEAASREASRSWLAEVRDAIAYRPEGWENARASSPDRLHPVQMLRPLQAVLDGHPDSVLIADGGEIGQWATACLSAPHRVINGVAGSIGSGLPYALGARYAEPDAPVVAVMGDGTVGFHIAEFDTAVRHGLSLVCMVGNDARWNAEYQIQLRDYGPDRLIGCELRPLRYEQVAQAFGAYGECVSRADDLAPAVDRAMASGLPACVNVNIEGVAAPQIRR